MHLEVKMAAVEAGGLSRGLGLNLHGHGLALLRGIYRLVVQLQRRNLSQIHAALRRHADGRAHLHSHTSTSQL